MADDLTGLLTYRELPAGLADRTPCAIVVDVDCLLWLNDQLGFDAGNRALALVARTLVDQLRDVPGSAVFRIGGDEFMVVLPDVTSTSAELIASSLVAHVHELNIPYRRTDQPERTSLEVNATVVRITPGFVRDAFGEFGLVQSCRDWIGDHVYRKKERSRAVGVVVNLTDADWAAQQLDYEVTPGSSVDLPAAFRRTRSKR